MHVRVRILLQVQLQVASTSPPNTIWPVFFQYFFVRVAFRHFANPSNPCVDSNKPLHSVDFRYILYPILTPPPDP
uniref:Secreted protein n=1 Tax=Syphacia muris TaxID=451379 RepID=A0A0N5ARA6_9BILA